MIRSRCLAYALVVLVAAPSLARADVKKSTADALFYDGKKLLEQKDYAAACPKLAESHKLQPGGGVVLALALCLEGQGKLASSLNAYREALVFARRDKRKDREEASQKKIAELDPKVSRLTLDVAPAAKAQQIVVEIDDVAVPSASFGVAIPVDGGTHLVVAKAEGKLDRKIDVEIAAQGDRKILEIGPLDDAPSATKPKEPPPVVSKPEAPPEAPKPGGSSTRTIGFVVAGVGVVGLGVGSFFGLSAMSKAREVRDACPNGTCTDPSMLDRNAEAKSAATLSNVAFGVGALALGVGVVLIVTGAPEPAPKQTMKLTPHVGLGSVALELAW